MKKLLLLAALACSTFAVGGALHAQDAEAPAEQAQTQAANREDTPEYKAFADEMVKYKDALKKLRGLKEAYQTASPEEKDRIVSEFTPLVNATTQQQKGLVPLAIAAYKSVEGQNSELRAFLCAMLQWLTYERENYEAAYEIAKVVMQYPLPETNGDLLYGFAAFAAFATMNLDDAKAWYKIAKD